MAPACWEPSKLELQSSVIRINADSEGSEVYLWLPGPMSKSPTQWDMSQYRPCFQTALNIAMRLQLVNEPNQSLPTGMYNGVMKELELYCLPQQPSPSLLRVLLSWTMDATTKNPPSVCFRQQARNPLSISLVLPNYYPTHERNVGDDTETGFFYTKEKTREVVVEEFVDRVKELLFMVFGADDSADEDEGHGFSGIVVVDAARVLQLETTDDFAAYTCIASGDPDDAILKLATDEQIHHLISRSVENQQPLFVHPIYEAGFPALRPVYDEEPGVFVQWRGMVPDIHHSRSVRLLWNVVLVKAPDSTTMPELENTYLRIRPCVPKYAREMGLVAPTYYVRPETTDDEWFAIRAQLITRFFDFALVAREVADAAILPAEGVTWGPRYGLAGRVTRVRDEYEETEGSDNRDADVVTEAQEQRPRARKTVPGRRQDDAPARQPRNTGLQTPDSFPEADRAILTSTEQARLQQAHQDLRDVKLYRAINCPERGCGDVFSPSNEGGLSEHYQVHHLADKCPWCVFPLPVSWTVDQKNKHFREKHSQQLLYILGLQEPSTYGSTNKRDTRHAGSLRSLSRDREPFPYGRYASTARLSLDHDEDEHGLSLPPGEVYCSRCLRGFPAAGSNNHAVRESQMKVGFKLHQQMKIKMRIINVQLHLKAEKSCRISNTNGCVQGLPNANGWVNRKDLEAVLGEGLFHQAFLQLKKDIATPIPARAIASIGASSQR